MIPDNRATSDSVTDDGSRALAGLGDDRGNMPVSSVMPVDTTGDSLIGRPLELASALQKVPSATTVAFAAPRTMLSLRRSIENGARKDEKAEQEDEKVGLAHDDKDTFSGETIPAEDEKPQQHHRLKDISEGDAVLAQGKKRNKWYQIWRPKNDPPRPPDSLDQVGEIPLATASIVSQLTYSWVTPLMTLGYQRPLMATDLWKMDRTREARLLSDKFMDAYTRREVEAKAYNASLVDSVNPVKPSRLQRFKWHVEVTIHPRRNKISSIPIINDDDGGQPKVTARAQKLQILEEEWRQDSGRRKASIVMSLNDTMSGFWAGGLYKVLGDTAQLMCPLLTKALINFSKEGDVQIGSILACHC